MAFYYFLKLFKINILFYSKQGIDKLCQLSHGICAILMSSLPINKNRILLQIFFLSNFSFSGTTRATWPICF